MNSGGRAPADVGGEPPFIHNTPTRKQSNRSQAKKNRHRGHRSRSRSIATPARRTTTGPVETHRGGRRDTVDTGPAYTQNTRRDSSNAVFTVSHLFRGHTPHILIHAPRPLHSVLRDGSPLRLRKYTELSLPSRLHPALRTPLGLLPQIPAGAPVAPDSGSPPHRCAQTSEYTPA